MRLKPILALYHFFFFRFNHIYASSLKCNRPLLLTGPQGVGKTRTVWAKLLASADLESYRFRLLPSTNSAEFKVCQI